MLEPDNSVPQHDPQPLPGRTAMKLLLVEDDYDVASNVCEYLEAAGHTVEVAPDGLIGLDCVTREQYECVILDINLPRLTGIQLCERIRNLGFSDLPILMLTAMGDLSYKEEAYEAGADDYLVKPFALKELALRITAVVRRVGGSRGNQALHVGDLRYDVMTQQVTRADQAIDLAATPRAILELLMRNSHRVVSKREIEQTVWHEPPESPDLVRIHIHTLREAIDKPFSIALIHTVRGMGYRLYFDDSSIE